VHIWVKLVSPCPCQALADLDQLTASDRVILIEKLACETLFVEMLGWNSGKV
jgi:hypothetical protein